ncbi:ankyrin repeat domain-containing protein [Vibrio gallaecicus]|uniref:ankyrin repeat domain-containing protein n=1 Tax=Vibrio gallaecicus TaxID=552386 RepID=UPI0010C95DC9|nr:ankyrin repeat domain-containing protein [Vibrio gallaecicus]MDN3617458.1 ankyrin repeat domain-containing protein [Vibrio gallaecicus]
MDIKLPSCLLVLAMMSGCSDNVCQSDPTTEFNVALESLIKARDESLSLQLIQNGLDVNYQNNCGASLLHISTIVGNEPLVMLLLSKSANPNVLNWQGESPVYMAAQWAEDDILIKLLQAGATPNLVAGDAAFSPLMIAVFNENISTVEILIAHGANTDFVNENGLSASSIARENGYEEILSALETKVP